MKNTYKLLSIIAMVAIIAFSMASCELDPGDDGVPKVLEIKNFPANDGNGTSLRGKQITVALCQLDNADKPVINAVDQLNIPTSTTGNTTLSSELVSGKKKGGKAFTGTGDYYVFIFVDVNDEDSFDDDITYFYAGATGTSTSAKIFTITDAISGIEWSSFRKSS